MNPQELKQVMVLANPFKEGDLLLGGTGDEQISQDARARLESLRLAEITKPGLVDDEVTAALDRSLNRQLTNELSVLTVAETKPFCSAAKPPAGWRAIAMGSQAKQSPPL